MTTWRDGLAPRQKKLLEACDPRREAPWRRLPIQRLMDLVHTLERMMDAHEAVGYPARGELGEGE